MCDDRSRAFYVQSSCYIARELKLSKEPLSLIRSSPNYRKCAFTFFDALQSRHLALKWVSKKTASAEFTDFHAQLHLE